MTKRYFYNILAFILFFASIVYYYLTYNEFSSLYYKEYIVIIICNVFMFLSLLYIFSRKNFYVFEPILFVWFLYYMIFVFRPLTNINNKNIYEFGINTMGGCVKGTIIFMISFLSLHIGYYFYSVDVNKKVINFEDAEKQEINKYERNKQYYVAIWIIGVISFLFFNMLAGRNPIYMLTFGTRNLGLGRTSSEAYGIIAVFIYISFYPMLNIIFFDKSLLLKIFVIYITCVPIATRGFRNVLTVCLLAPFVYYYTKDKREPPTKIVLLTIIVFFMMFGFIGSTRNNLRSGRGLVTNEYKYSSGLDNVLYYFDSYKVYYGAIINYPDNYNYTMGKQLLYTLTMYIPRYLWRGKPGTPLIDAIRNSTSDVSAASGSAWPNIGEYYTDLGISGTIIIMFFLGILLSKMKIMYDAPNRQLKYVMLYSLFYPALVTIFAYGYTAGNTPQYVIMAFPLIFENFLEKQHRLIVKKEQKRTTN